MKLSDLQGDDAPAGKIKLSELDTPLEQSASGADVPEERRDHTTQPSEKRSWLEEALKPVTDIPRDIAEDFRAGGKQVAESLPKDGGFGNPLGTAMGGIQQFFSPVTGTARALVGDPMRANMPDNTAGKFAANTAEDVAGMAAGVPFTKMMAKPFDLVSRYRQAAKTSIEDKAEAKIMNRFEQDAKAGGVGAQAALDLVDAARKSGKAMTIADVASENVKGLAGNVARAPGESRTIAREFVKDRDQGAGARLTADVNKYLSTGSAYFTTQGLLESRAAGGHPLYETAFEGGSIAPLEKQFEQAFADSSKEVSAASDAVNNILARITKAKTAPPGTSPDGNKAVMNALQEELDKAESTLNAAQENKGSVLETLRQAQKDGTSGVKGAVWNPRINQFLKDPITKGGIARGLEIQRLEALAENRPFNPLEYAIVGTDEQGMPIIGKVPNMRLLNAAKKGMDAIIQENQNPITGKLNEKGRAVDMVRRAFLGELDAINPDYKTARDFWSGKSKSMESVTWGRNILSGTPEENAAELAAMSAGDREFAKLGAADLIRERILKTGVGGDEAKAIIKSDWAKAQIRPLFNSDKEFNEFINSVTHERTMFDTKQLVMGGSQTAERLAEDKTNDLLLGISGLHGAAQTVSGNVMGALRTMVRMRRDLGLRNNPKLNEAIAKILFDPQIEVGRLSDPAVKEMRFQGKPDRSAGEIMRTLGIPYEAGP